MRVSVSWLPDGCVRRRQRRIIARVRGYTYRADARAVRRAPRSERILEPTFDELLASYYTGGDHGKGCAHGTHAAVEYKCCPQGISVANDARVRIQIVVL